MKNGDTRLFNEERRKIDILPSSATLANAAVQIRCLLNGKETDLKITVQNQCHSETYMSLPAMIGAGRITVIGLDKVRQNCYFISKDGGEKEPCDIVITG